MTAAISNDISLFLLADSKVYTYEITIDSPISLSLKELTVLED